MSGRRAFLWAAVLLGVAAPAPAAEPAARPNIIVILADDLGYGDVGCYGASRVRTPNIDRLAAGGLRFTDGHCTSATCTPSRYALLTGQYPWRKKGTDVLPGDASLVVPTDRMTLPSMLGRAGYATGVVGKWHLGLGKDRPDWNGDIRPGPLEVGFDYAFIIPATGDRVPCVYVENHRVVGLDPADPIRVSFRERVGDEPTGKEHPELLRLRPSLGHDQTIVRGVGRIGYMSGGKAARWVDEDMADVLTRKAVAFVEKNRARPFFLYFASHDVHVPRLPHRRFAGKSGCGVRGDAIVELDACVGEVLRALDRLKLADNTLVIFSSDNGPVVDDGYRDGAVEDLHGHRPAGPLRGGKYVAYEGGTRVPFIVRWPARVKPGVSPALVCQIDLLASLARLVRRKLPEEAGPDSLDVLPALLGESQSGRADLVEHAGALALRQGPWKYIEPPRAAGREGKLFNLEDDLGESKNLIRDRPEKAREMAALLRQIVERGRSRPAR